MNFRKRALKLSFVAMVAITLISVTVAAYLLTRQIQNSMRMVGAAEMKLVREDDPTVEVTSIAWGDFTPLGIKTSQNILGTRILIHNLGNLAIVVGWNVTGLDTTFWAISATWAGYNYPQNDFNQFRIDPGQVNGYMVFTLNSIDPHHPPMDSSFMLNFNVQQAP